MQAAKFIINKIVQLNQDIAIINFSVSLASICYFPSFLDPF